MSELQGDVYVIWSNEHRMWWGPGRCGYTEHYNEAGRYSQEAAFDLCRQALPTAMHIGMISEIPVRVMDMSAVLNGALIPPNIL